MAQESLRAVSAGLAMQTEALAALGGALRLKASAQVAPGLIQASLDEVVAALGLTETLATATPEELSRALAPIRALLLQAVDLLTDPTRSAGWTYMDAELLQSLGQTSAAFAGVVREALVPRLDGLGESLEQPGAAFLDVGVGVAALSIDMCRLFEHVRVVGIDPWETALELARRNVAAARLEGRVELRLQGIEELPDESAFDLAFLASPFLPEGVVDVACSRTLVALRPGGWVLFAMFRGDGPLESALAHLRTARSGGVVLDAGDAEARLRAAGFDDVATLPAELGIPSQLVVGRRPA
jgi:precorrin-6B methylase 2